MTTCANGTTQPSRTVGAAAPAPSRSAAPAWRSIDEKDCTDAACTQCTDNGSFNTSTCLETTEPGLYITGNCSVDGKRILELTFADAQCRERTGSYPNPAGTCIKNRGAAGYTLYTCGAAPAPPAPPGPSPRSCGKPYPDCVANADAAACVECAPSSRAIVDHFAHECTATDQPTPSSTQLQPGARSARSATGAPLVSSAATIRAPGRSPTPPPSETRRRAARRAGAAPDPRRGRGRGGSKLAPRSLQTCCGPTERMVRGLRRRCWGARPPPPLRPARRRATTLQRTFSPTEPCYSSAK